jgi:hypothetical protein
VCVRRGGGVALHSFVLFHSRRRRVDAAPDVGFFRTIALASAITAPSRSRALKKLKKTTPVPDRRVRTRRSPPPDERKT